MLLQVRAPLAACAAMSDRITPGSGNLAAGVDMRNIMINPIGAMHANIQADKRAAEKVGFKVEVKKPRRVQPAEMVEHTREERHERGDVA